VKEKEEKLYGEYRTRRLVLEAFEKLAKSPRFCDKVPKRVSAFELTKKAMTPEKVGSEHWCNGLRFRSNRWRWRINESEIKQANHAEVLSPVNETKEEEQQEQVPFTFLEYLDSDRGHEIAKEVLSLWKELQKATIGSKSEQTKEELKRNHEAWRLGILLQTILAVVVIVTAGALAWHSKMDATLAGFLGVALGYVLGRKAR